MSDKTAPAIESLKAQSSRVLVIGFGFAIFFRNLSQCLIEKNASTKPVIP